MLKIGLTLYHINTFVESRQVNYSKDFLYLFYNFPSDSSGNFPRPPLFSDEKRLFFLTARPHMLPLYS